MAPELVDVYPYRKSESEFEFLILQRAPEVIYAGEWRMVGGKVEKGENASDAAIRELKEETGIEPELLWCVPDINSFFDFQRNKVHHIPVFAAECSTDAKPVLNHEHTRWAWKSVAELEQFLLWPEHLRLTQLIYHLLREDKLSRTWMVGSGPSAGTR